MGSSSLKPKKKDIIVKTMFDIEHHQQKQQPPFSCRTLRSFLHVGQLIEVAGLLNDPLFCGGWKANFPEHQWDCHGQQLQWCTFTAAFAVLNYLIAAFVVVIVAVVITFTLCSSSSISWSAARPVAMCHFRKNLSIDWWFVCVVWMSVYAAQLLMDGSGLNTLSWDSLGVIMMC